MVFEEVFKTINKAKLIKTLVLLKNWKRGSVDVAFSRGQISKDLSFDLEELTTISALYWQSPDLYNMNGERKINPSTKRE